MGHNYIQRQGERGNDRCFIIGYSNADSLPNTSLPKTVTAKHYCKNTMHLC